MINAQFTFHPERCVGCGACVMACINENGLDTDAQLPYRLLKNNEYVTEEKVEVTYFTHGCMHCKDRPCEGKCPRQCFSYNRAAGVVTLDNTMCVGCHACERVCPYKAISFKDKKAYKCNGCLKNLSRDRLPACVMACPRQAITIDEKNAVVDNGLKALKAELDVWDERRK